MLALMAGTYLIDATCSWTVSKWPAKLHTPDVALGTGSSSHIQCLGTLSICKGRKLTRLVINLLGAVELRDNVVPGFGSYYSQ